jgi:hypothetical protein
MTTSAEFTHGDGGEAHPRNSCDQRQGEGQAMTSTQLVGRTLSCGQQTRRCNRTITHYGRRQAEAALRAVRQRRLHAALPILVLCFVTTSVATAAASTGASSASVVEGRPVTDLVTPLGSGRDQRSSPLSLAAGRRPLPGDRLPPGLAVRSPRSPAAADGLAGRLAAAVDDPNTRLPAVITAFRTSGIAVRRANGRLGARGARPRQGFAMDAWELAGIADSYGQPSTLTLNDVAAALAKGSPRLRRAKLGRLLLAGIRRRAMDRQLTSRLWARLIVERGRRGSTPYNALDGRVGPEAVTLDPLAQALVLDRLAMDLQARAHRPGGRAAAAARSASPPCTLSDAEQKIMDAAALAETTGFDKLMEYLDEHGSKHAGRLQTSAGWANVILAYTKLVIMKLAFEAKISLDGSGPVIRTKLSEQDGENRLLRLEARFNIGRGQWVNCIRLALAHAGVDFDLPNDGPLAGANVHWRILEGGPTGSGELPIVQFWGATAPTARVTGKDGRSVIGIQGYHQPKRVPDYWVEWPRQATVEAQLQAQAADPISDLIDALGSRDGLGLFTIPAELLQRTRWLWNVTERIEVTDWRPGGVRFKANWRREREGSVYDFTLDVAGCGHPPGAYGWSGEMRVLPLPYETPLIYPVEDSGVLDTSWELDATQPIVHIKDDSWQAYLWDDGVAEKTITVPISTSSSCSG